MNTFVGIPMLLRVVGGRSSTSSTPRRCSRCAVSHRWSCARGVAVAGSARRHPSKRRRSTTMPASREPRRCRAIRRPGARHERRTKDRLRRPGPVLLGGIHATAKALGVAVVDVKPDDLLAWCHEAKPDLVILDLHGTGEPIECARALKADLATRDVPLVGFYSHVDEDARRAAGRRASIASCRGRRSRQGWRTC